METPKSRFGWMSVPLLVAMFVSWAYLFWSGFASFALMWVGPTGPDTWEKLCAFGSMQVGLLAALASELLLFVVIIPKTGRAYDFGAGGERQNSKTALVAVIALLGSLIVAAGPVLYLWITGRTGAFDESELMASIVYLSSSFFVLLLQALEYSLTSPSVP